MKLELYYYDTCPYCHFVMRTIDALRIEKHIQFKNIFEQQEYALELIRINGHQQVPCLVIDGHPLLESADINQYFHANFSQ